MKSQLVLLATATFMLAACGDDRGPASTDSSPAPADRRGAQLGAIAPRLESRTLEGVHVTLDSLRGSPVLLNVWATWCHPCRDEIPVLQAIHERNSARGLRVIGVSIDDAGRTADIRRFATEMGMTYSIWLDPDQRVMPSFSVIGVPTTVLIDKDGRLLWRRTGEVKSGDVTLEAAIDSALSSPSSANATS